MVEKRLILRNAAPKCIFKRLKNRKILSKFGIYIPNLSPEWIQVC